MMADFIYYLFILAGKSLHSLTLGVHDESEWGGKRGPQWGVITQLGWTGDISTKSVALASHTLSRHGAPCLVVGGVGHWTQTSSAASPLQVSWDGRVAPPCTAPQASDSVSSFSPAPSSLSVHPHPSHGHPTAVLRACLLWLCQS